MRILGLDYGTKTVGVAVSAPLMLTAQGLEIIRRKEENKLRQTLARIEELVEEYDISLIVLGLPKHMNNSEGVRVESTMEFKEKLERRLGLEIVMWDERLTTVAADRTMMEVGIRRENSLSFRDILTVLHLRKNRNRRIKNMADTEKLVFQTEDGKEVEFEVVESTRVNGADYLLVTTDDTTVYDSENDDDDSEAVFILKDTSAPESEEALYEFVDDEEELDAVFKIFEQLLDEEE